MRNRASESVRLRLCRAPSCADVSETVAKALPCQSCTHLSETVAEALPCQICADISETVARVYSVPKLRGCVGRTGREAAAKIGVILALNR